MDTKPVTSPVVLDYAKQPRNLRHLFRLIVKTVESLLLIVFCAVVGFVVTEIIGPKAYTATAYLRLDFVASNSGPAMMETVEGGGCRIELIDFRTVVKQITSLLPDPTNLRNDLPGARWSVQSEPETSLIAVGLSASRPDKLQTNLNYAVDGVVAQKPTLLSRGLMHQLSLARKSGVASNGVTALSWRVSGPAIGGALGLVLLFKLCVLRPSA